MLQINSELFPLLSSFIGGGALGSLISTVVNHKENRRIKKSDATRSEAAAKREDASAATEMMGLLERTVALFELLQSQRTEDYRRITALEKTMETELAWRKDGDYHYCEVEDCKNRKPPMGTFRRE
ncbi:MULTISPECIES: hypothetical protein [Proteiniphilum]|uniref:hypothetical protein n=1 Tax=Proteiniphilum TaxID=294702 RepID=UPI0003A52A2D|nr:MULTISPECIES: hypothetical protein [Proteiniphilum]MDY9918622.1 hypothetical protein [Proteiniphilum sp.]SEA15467.1 hypothetical protein SAMN05216331_12212 [Porphyromonadaceae bacterium KH3R12]